MAQGHRLQQLLEEEGFDVLWVPMIEIEPLAEIDSAQRRSLFDLDGFDHLIFVSTNAVRLGMDAIEEAWPQLPSGPTWHGIGAATSKALADRGVEVYDDPGGMAMNSEELLARPCLLEAAGKRVLLVRGAGGRTLLADTLTDRGAEVRHLEVYQRNIPLLSETSLAATIVGRGVDLILFSSGEALDNMCSVVAAEDWEAICNIPVLVAGRRNCRRAQDKGFRAVFEADNPSDEAMVGAVLDWQQGVGEST